MLLSNFANRCCKENSAAEVKEQADNKPSPEYSPDRITGDKRWNLDFNMWHSVGPAKVLQNKKEMVESGEGMHRTHSQRNLANECVNYSVCDLVTVLNDNNKEKMARMFLAMSSSPESCSAIRQSGYMPLLIELIHDKGGEKYIRDEGRQALRNIVYYHSDDKQGRRESRVLKLVEEIYKYCEGEDDSDNGSGCVSNPEPLLGGLMKLSFDEEHRVAMCQLGALHTLAELIRIHHERNEVDGGNEVLSKESLTLRRYACMTLTNLTFGDGANKSTLCSFGDFMRALIRQLDSSSEDLCQVTASVLRNLSWRSDETVKEALRDGGAVVSLMKTALRMKKESTLKAVLSALWNMSAHCAVNKVDICAVDGAVEYLVKMLNYQAPSKTLVIVESVGGILRNVSSHIAVREDYRSILRRHNCLQTLLHQLKSPSLTVVGNACGTLWNLSARCSEDQTALWDLGAVPMLRSLIHSKLRQISVASSATLKNLLAAKPEGGCDGIFQGGSTGAGLAARKRRAFEQELDSAYAAGSGGNGSGSSVTSPMEEVFKRFSISDTTKEAGRKDKELERKMEVRRSIVPNEAILKEVTPKQTPLRDFKLDLEGGGASTPLECTPGSEDCTLLETVRDRNAIVGVTESVVKAGSLAAVNGATGRPTGGSGGLDGREFDGSGFGANKASVGAVADIEGVSNKTVAVGNGVLRGSRPRSGIPMPKTFSKKPCVDSPTPKEAESQRGNEWMTKSEEDSLSSQDLSDFSILCPSQDTFLKDSKILPLKSDEDDEEEMVAKEEEEEEGAKPAFLVGKPTRIHAYHHAHQSPMKTSTNFLDSVQPPSFLAEAHLENSLTNVDSIVSEIADSWGDDATLMDDQTMVEDGVSDNEDDGRDMEDFEEAGERMTPKQKRREMKDRYGTYTLSPGRDLKGTWTKNEGKREDQRRKTCRMRRNLEADRFKTRTIAEGDFSSKESQRYPESGYNEDEGGRNHSDEEEGLEEGERKLKPKVVIPKGIRGGQPRARPSSSGIPVFHTKPALPRPSSAIVGTSKLQQPKIGGKITNKNNNSNSNKKQATSKLPAPLHRQGTFTKEENAAKNRRL